MAVLAAAIVLLSSGTVTPDDETAILAAQVGVSPMELQGALNATGASPQAYLIYEGLLEPPATQAPEKTLPPSVADSPPAPTSGVWASLAQCESNGRWDRNSGNGYTGGLQFDAATWRRHGGLAYAPAAYLASREQQIAVARVTAAVQGFSAWPVCSRRLGLR